MNLMRGGAAQLVLWAHAASQLKLWGPADFLASIGVVVFFVLNDDSVLHEQYSVMMTTPAAPAPPATPVA